MSAWDRTRGDGSLADFFRSLARGPFRHYTSASSSPSPDTIHGRAVPGQRRLEFFDSGLVGKTGAQVILQALEVNKAVDTLVLANNALGDEGLLELVVGMKRLRARGVGGRLLEINLSGNRLTDTSLHLLILHLLLPSPHPSTLTHLYLSGNAISLSCPELAAFLGTTLSSPQSRLECLNLTSNPIGLGNRNNDNYDSSRTTAYFSTFLEHLRLRDHSSLSQLHFSLCALTPDVVEPLTQWLSDPEGGGKRIQVLGLNGNHLSDAGVRKIQSTIGQARCTGMLQLETLSNSRIGEEWRDLVKFWEGEEEGVDLEKGRREFEEVKTRNKLVLKETRDAALSLLGPARILFCAARTPEIDVDLVRKTVEGLKIDSLPNSVTHPTPPPPSRFPLLLLPVEIRVHILRCYLLLDPSSLAHLYPPISPTSASPPPPLPTPPVPALLSSPLTESQFLSVLLHASDPTTLQSEIQLLERAGKFPSIHQFSAGWENARGEAAGRGVNLDVADLDGVWEEWMLRKTGCDRFERAMSGV